MLRKQESKRRKSNKLRQNHPWRFCIIELHNILVFGCYITHSCEKVFQDREVTGFMKSYKMILKHKSPKVKEKAIVKWLGHGGTTKTLLHASS